MTGDLDELFGRKDLRTFPLTARQLVGEMRRAIHMAQCGNDPRATIALRLGSVGAAQAITRLVATLGAVWPYLFLVAMPNEPALSPDEALLAEIAAAAARNDRSMAMAAMRDLLPADVRERIWREVESFVAALRTARTQPANDRG